MKIRALLIAAAAFLTLSVTSAQAATNFSGAAIAMGNTVIGQNGTITGDLNVLNGSALGTIPAHSMISFTYNLVGALDALQISQGSYSYAGPGGIYAGSAAASTFSPPLPPVGTLNGAPSTPLLNALVGITSPFSGWAQIINNSNGVASFSTLIWAISLAPGASITAQYIVQAVPLPAALPLFGLGLAGLVAARRRKNLAA